MITQSYEIKLHREYTISNHKIAIYHDRLQDTVPKLDGYSGVVISPDGNALYFEKHDLLDVLYERILEHLENLEVGC